MNALKHKRSSHKKIDLVFGFLFKMMAILSASMIVILVLFILIKGIRPFLPGYSEGSMNLMDFLFGLTYRQDQGIYGIGFIVLNTLISAFLALSLSFPVAVLTALFVVKMAPKRYKSWMKSTIELLASIPSIVYGVFASSVITNVVQNLAHFLGIQTAGGSSLLAVVVLLAIMIFPTMAALSISAIEAVDQDLEKASLALGASATQTHFKVVLISAKSGIFAGAILGLGRAFGEATAVAMVAGNKLFGPTWNPFDITRTLTSTMLSGLKETTGLDYDLRFSIGIVLMVVIFASNALLNAVRRRILM